MLESDPITAASTALQAAALDVLKGGDPNRLRGPYVAYLRALGRGKQANLVALLPPLAWTKPKVGK